jgi:ATP-dependent Clp protease adaptor protein ClpS
MSNIETHHQDDVLQETQENLQEPPLYKVLLLNDDYTSMEFVVQVLVQVFNRSVEAATQIMLHVHHQGVGVCGVYTCEVAETKIATVHALARENGFPLQCVMEPD